MKTTDKKTSKKKSGKSLAADIVAKAEARKKEASTEGKKIAASLKAQHAEESNKRGHEIALASSRGYALSHAYADDAVDRIGKVLGDRFKVTEGGLSVVGKKLTELEAAKAIATLAEVTERGDVIRGTSMLAFGDLIVVVEETFGEKQGGELVEQAVSILGKSKHTVQEARRIALAFPKGERPKGLTYSHYALLKDAKGSGEVTPAKLSKIIETIQEGEVVSTVIIDGKKKEQRKPLTCAATKRLINEAKGKPEKPSKPDKPHLKEQAPAYEGLTGFLYILLEDTNEVFTSMELDHDALKSGDYAIIDLQGSSVVGPKGELYCLVKPLPVKEAEPEKTESAKPEKKTKSKPEPKAKVEDEMP